MRKIRGKFYTVCKNHHSHGDTTIILCTKSSYPKDYTFQGVVVKGGNNTFVGQKSSDWTSHMFNEEVENKF